MKLKILVVLVILIFWPVSLIIHNQNSELITFLTPAILLALTYNYYSKNCWYYVLPLLLIPAIAPKLTLFPVLFLLFDYFVNYHPEFSSGSKKKILKGVQNDNIRVVFVIISIVLIAINWPQFKGQTVFTSDYEAQQLVIRNQQLYPTPLTARIFHNKFRIVGDKVVSNFFELTDPNNYFFGFAPRQVIGNQNLQKFPFLTIVPFLWGLYYISQSKDKRFIILATTASLINLSLLTLYDKNDFVLYVPFVLIMINGLQAINSYRFKNVFYVIFLCFSVIEFVRIVI